jgi:sugar/nucleoside kinase (ribokinase family)
MLQREVSDSVNITLAEYAREKGIKVLLDVGGQDIRLNKEFLKNVDIISPNETELLRIIKHGIEFDLFSDESVIKVCNSIIDDSENQNLEFLIKLGSKGSLFLTKENKIYRQNAINVSTYKIVDTTGAGDCFTGAFIGKYSELSSNGELDIQSCLKFASAAAFSCITKYGTSNSMPTKEEAQNILNLSSK